MKLSLCLAVAALATTAITAAQPKNATFDTLVDDEGLVSVKVQGLNHVYVRPDADLSRYTQVMINTVEVSFRETGNLDSIEARVTAKEQQSIREALGKLLRVEFVKELVRCGRYPLVETADKNVLSIKAEIRDVEINASDLSITGTSGTYRLFVDKMRLVAELRDAPTGALIARVIDFKKDPQSAWMKLTRRIDNITAARRAAANWAKILRGQLDAAYGVAGKT